jgi:hypothetical protein
MSVVNPAASQQAVVEAALVLLERMGLSPADLTGVPQAREMLVPDLLLTGSPRGGQRKDSGSRQPGSIAHHGERLWLSSRCVCPV